MRLIALDASGPMASVAAVEDERLLYEAALCMPKAHAARLAPMLQEMLAHLGLAAKDFDGIACVNGPGSFTGVRIGVATAMGIAYGAGLRVAPVDALWALASAHAEFDGLVCPILDARAGQVYAALFRGDSRLMPDAALPLGDCLARARELADGRILFVGDGVAAHREAIARELGDAAAFSTQPLRAYDAAMAAMKQGYPYLEPEELLPLYLRAPQAEREREKRLKEEGHG